MRERTLTAGLTLLCVLTIPSVGWSDVAAPSGSLVVGIAEGCPPADDLTVDDLDDVYDAGCGDLEVRSLYDEVEVTDGLECSYGLECLDEGGCG